MEIRSATHGDIVGIQALLRQVADIHHNGRPDLFKAGISKYTFSELERIIENADTPVLVAVDEDGTVIGHAFCVLKHSGDTAVLYDRLTLYIDDICVDEAHRGNHIGTELCNTVLSLAKQFGCYNVTLNVWALNGAASAFYKSFGFDVQKTTMEMLI